MTTESSESKIIRHLLLFLPKFNSIDYEDVSFFNFFILNAPNYLIIFSLYTIIQQSNYILSTTVLWG